jgi:hypothetical protein
MTLALARGAILVFSVVAAFELWGLAWAFYFSGWSLDRLLQ